MKVMFSRYKRVYEIMRNDNNLKRTFSGAVVAVCKPNQTTEDMPVEVVTLTDELQARGNDVNIMSKVEIIGDVHRMLFAKSRNTPVLKSMFSISVEEFLKQRLELLQASMHECKQRLDELKKERDVCLAALGAIRLAPEPEEKPLVLPPPPVVPPVIKAKTELMAKFENKVREMVGSAPRSGIGIYAFMEAHNASNQDDQLSYSACKHRLRRMATHKLIKYVDGVVYAENGSTPA